MKWIGVKEEDAEDGGAEDDVLWSFLKWTTKRKLRKKV